MASPKTESSPEYLASSVEQVAGRLVEDCECLQGLPRELLVDIAEHFPQCLARPGQSFHGRGTV